MAKIKIIFNKELSTLGILLSVIILSTIIGLGIHLVFAAPWVGPLSNPPDDNVAPPITTAGGQTINGDLTITGNIFGSNRFDVNSVGSGVFDDTTSNAPYSRVSADSFHTNGLGVGQMYIEGYAIDSNSAIRIGTGLAGGQTSKNVTLGGDATVNNNLTVSGGNLYLNVAQLYSSGAPNIRAFYNRADDGTYEWFGWYSGSGSRAGIFLWDGDWNGCDADKFCIFGETHQLMLKSLTGDVLIDDNVHITGNLTVDGTGGGGLVWKDVPTTFGPTCDDSWYTYDATGATSANATAVIISISGSGGRWFNFYTRRNGSTADFEGVARQGVLDSTASWGENENYGAMIIQGTDSGQVFEYKCRREGGYTWQIVGYFE